MARQRPSHAYKVSRKARREGAALPALRVAAAGILAAYLAWLLFFPGLAGGMGQWCDARLKLAFGAAAYLLPLFILNAMAHYLRSERGAGWITLAAGSAAALLSAATLLSMLGAWISPAGALGGAAGRAVSAALTGWMGAFGCALVALACGGVSTQVIAGIRWGKVLGDAGRLLAEDYQEWMRSRRELAAWQERSAQAGPKPGAPAAPSDEAQRARAPEAPPQPAVPAAEPERREKPAREGGPAPAKARPKTAAPLPAIDLLDMPKRDRESGLPTQAELDDASSRLQQTFANFEVQASITGVLPGPVITRYEISPAPGVKVSSIVALENDIALAMKARGIRMIAPIPGKAAVGIEIPNARPVLVALREILASPAFTPKSPALSFAVGLTGDGTPLAADLASMPHLLVAGATGSGKSVLIHSLILSILFRAGPEHVKFLMIDPKRLELTFYEGIPHLFDPTVPAEKVQVVTNAKAAAHSLNAMVKVMEKRYERFQACGARNIEGFNQAMAKQGLAEEPYIVVVIDELADLMLVSREGVEDSIQRLAQMARAVGIHLVLATQRPSVDVITGVIKANLPSRVALQVTSKVDSRVILDSVGAEALQGKGDLLYLAAGAQKPARCQGAYVGEEEIRRVADYLRSTGKPDYPPLDTMPKPAEADLKSYGVEPGEFREALKLVLERRRVSQDLLKSQFGSSARATNLLSLLEVKGMIHKPEGTNRWEIEFAMIAEYLKSNFPADAGSDVGALP